jgi:hypothetical protein
MKPPARDMGVLSQIIGIKISEALEFHKLSLSHHTS